MHVRISHFTGETASPDYDPPFLDPLIDEAFLEFTALATLFSDRFPAPQLLVADGIFSRVTLQIQANIQCAQGWNGTSCETFCNTTSDGNVSCSQGGLAKHVCDMTSLTITLSLI